MLKIQLGKSDHLGKYLFAAALSLALAAGSFAAYAAAPDYTEIKNAYENGARVFDGAGLFDESEMQEITQKALEVSEGGVLDCLIVTTDDAQGYTDERRYADEIYTGCAFGMGSDQSGAMLLIDMDNRQYYVYTKGAAIRYLTDSALSYICSEGIEPALSDADYAGAAGAFLDGIADFLGEGIYQNQFNEDSLTGEQDYYYNTEGSRDGDLGYVLIVALFTVGLSALIAYLPCRSIKRSYAMVKEKQQAQSFALAYQNGAAFQFAADHTEDSFVRRFVTSVPRPRQRHNDRPNGGSGFGGGRSTTFSSVGGGSHGGRGGSF